MDKNALNKFMFQVDRAIAFCDKPTLKNYIDTVLMVDKLIASRLQDIGEEDGKILMNTAVFISLVRSRGSF